MSRILAIDPGNAESAYAYIGTPTCRPIAVGKVTNSKVRGLLRGMHPCDVIAIEMVASYGMPVGAEVFETCVEIGRYVEIAPHAQLVYRREIKLHHCGNPRANDANITQALVDRFARGEPNRGKGTKKQPGWFYGFSADIWQAYALAVYIADTANNCHSQSVERVS